jgi:hypothetical protein
MNGRMPEEYYDRDFPNLRRLGYQRTSDPAYHNCIAYAAGDFVRKWWPGEYPPNSRDYWPPEIPQEETVEAFTRAFQTLGYVPCPNGSWEPGYEKVAIYVWRNEVQHMARQQEDGTWRSKLAGEEDIEHTLEGLEGQCYGNVAAFLKRPLANYVAPPPAEPSESRSGCASLFSRIWKRG